MDQQLLNRLAFGMFIQVADMLLRKYSCALFASLRLLTPCSCPSVFPAWTISLDPSRWAGEGQHAVPVIAAASHVEQDAELFSTLSTTASSYLRFSGHVLISHTWHPLSWLISQATSALWTSHYPSCVAVKLLTLWWAKNLKISTPRMKPTTARSLLIALSTRKRLLLLSLTCGQKKQRSPGSTVFNNWTAHTVTTWCLNAWSLSNSHFSKWALASLITSTSLVTITTVKCFSKTMVLTIQWFTVRWTTLWFNLKTKLMVWVKTIKWWYKTWWAKTTWCNNRTWCSNRTLCNNRIRCSNRTWCNNRTWWCSPKTICWWIKTWLLSKCSSRWYSCSSKWMLWCSSSSLNSNSNNSSTKLPQLSWWTI